MTALTPIATGVDRKMPAAPPAIVEIPVLRVPRVETHGEAEGPFVGLAANERHGLVSRDIGDMAGRAVFECFEIRIPGQRREFVEHRVDRCSSAAD